MWRVTESQLEALDASSMEDFVERMNAHFHKHFPGPCAELGEPATRAMIRSGIADARTRGATGEREICLYLGLLFELGPNFEARGEPAWVHAILSEPDRHALGRLDRIYDRLMAPEPQMDAEDSETGASV